MVFSPMSNKLAKNFLLGILRFILLILGELKVTGQENVPGEGPYIVAVNHMSKVDPPLMFMVMPDSGIRFFAGEKWKKHIIFGPIMRWRGAIYINRGEVDRKALREALNALAEGCVFGLAPEGTRSRVGSLIHARDGAAYLATRAKVPILPAGIINSDVLGDRMVHLKRTQMAIRFGKPFSLPDQNRRPKGYELAAHTHLIMIHIANLLPERYWGYYADSPALRALQAGEDPWPYCLEAEGITPQNG